MKTTTIAIPEALAKKLRAIKNDKGYKTIAEVVKEATEKLLKDNK